MGMLVRMDVRINPPERIMRGLGVNTTGRVQEFLTSRVLFRMRRYMPWLSGTTATGLTTMQTPSSIVVNAPYARYLYMGSKMRDPNGGGPFPIFDGADPLAAAHGHIIYHLPRRITASKILMS